MTIEQRLARLERENRRFKAIVLCALLSALSLFTMAQVRPNRFVETEGVTIIDKRGVKLASLGAQYSVGSDIGEPAMMFWNPDGSSSSFFMVLDGETTLRVAAGGANSVQATARPDGDARFVVKGSGGDQGAMAQIRVLPGSGTASFFLTDGGTLQGMMQQEPGKTPYIMLRNPDGGSFWSAP